MNRTTLLRGFSLLLAVMAIGLALLWLLREIGWLHFERPNDLVTPMLALAIISLLIGVYRKGTQE